MTTSKLSDSSWQVLSTLVSDSVVGIPFLAQGVVNARGISAIWLTFNAHDNAVRFRHMKMSEEPLRDFVVGDCSNLFTISLDDVETVYVDRSRVMIRINERGWEVMMAAASSMEAHGE